MAKLTQKQTGTLPATGYIRQRDLIPSIVPVSSPTLWRWCKAGRFPKPLKLGPRVTAWRVEDVRAWMAAQASASETVTSVPTRADIESAVDVLRRAGVGAEKVGAVAWAPMNQLIKKSGCIYTYPVSRSASDVPLYIDPKACAKPCSKSSAPNHSARELDKCLTLLKEAKRKTREKHVLLEKANYELRRASEAAEVRRSHLVDRMAVALEQARESFGRAGFIRRPGTEYWDPPVTVPTDPVTDSAETHDQVAALRRLLAEVCHGLDLGADLRSDSSPPPIDFANESVEAIREKLMLRAVFGAMTGGEQ